VESISKETAAGDGLSTNSSRSCNRTLRGVRLEEFAGSCTWAAYCQM